MEIGRNEATPAEENARQLANAFASERVRKELDTLKKVLGLSDNAIVAEKEIDRLLGILLSTAYFKGYMDRHRGEKLKKLYL
jgi:hypothetical protein